MPQHKIVQDFGAFLRPIEKVRNNLPGSFWFLTTSSFLVGNLIAWCAVKCLSFADPPASFVSTTVQSPQLTDLASVACSLTCFCVVWGLGFALLQGSSLILRITSALGAVACTLAEAAAPTNDNSVVPVLMVLASGCSVTSGQWQHDESNRGFR